MQIQRPFYDTGCIFIFLFPVRQERPLVIHEYFVVHMRNQRASSVVLAEGAKCPRPPKKCVDLDA